MRMLLFTVLAVLLVSEHSVTARYGYTGYRAPSRNNYVPSVRYSQGYSGNSYYRSYLSLYYYLYVPESYRVEGTTYNKGARGNVCKNYQANQNGTVLGLFQCPLEFEPPTHIYCCGKRELEYCCLPKDSPSFYGIIFGSLAAVAVTVAFFAVLYKLYTSSHKKLTTGLATIPSSKPPAAASAVTNSAFDYKTDYGMDYGKS